LPYAISCFIDHLNKVSLKPAAAHRAVCCQDRTAKSSR